MLKLSYEQVEMMKADVTARVPQEACGLVAGKKGQAVKVFPISNVLNSPVRFRMNPQEQLKAFNEIDERSWELQAIYHSHPAGPAGLSTIDIAEAYYPDVIHILWFREAGEWRFRGYTIQSGNATEIQLELVQDVDG
jgi:proteasome lid subunit RPN8/RPN11